MIIRRALLGIVLSLVAGVVLAACGGSSHDGMGTGSSDPDARTVNIQMTDLAFTPASISVKSGETVKFIFANKGNVRHDAFIGDNAAQLQHASEMSSGSGSMGGHDMPSDGAITVEPGKTGQLTMTFDVAGALEIGCHEPGHYEAGMRATVNVA